jgi:O-acetylhomoserine (thiol)-lyase
MFGHHDNGAMRARADVRHRRAPRATGEIMKSETIAMQCGYEPEPAIKAVAVPIHQAAACAFDSAEHGAALFNLETDDYRCGRIGNPTTDVLEGGVEVLCVATRQAALNCAALNVTELGRNVVSVPRLYGMMVAKSLMTVPKSSE